MVETKDTQSVSIHEEITTVLFISLTIFALTEMIGLFSSAIMVLEYPFSSIIPMTMVFFGILGLLGILTDSRINTIIALIAVLIELTILSMVLITNPMVSFLIPTLTLQFLLISLSIFGFMTILRQQKTRTEYFFEPDQEKETDLAIEIKNLTKEYDLGEVKISALHNFNLEIQRGDFIAIMGPSGSGKSTLLNCLGALDRPTEGEIFIDGINISQLDDEGLAWLRNKKVGFIFQSYNLITRSSVGQNVEVPALVTPLDAHRRKKKALQVLDDVGLGDKYYRSPNTLSGGEQQRVAIARALINNPTILLADEPTGNLDSKSGAVVMEILQKLNRELHVTLIVVTHDPEVGSLADRIYYLKDGMNAGFKDNIKI